MLWREQTMGQKITSIALIVSLLALSGVITRLAWIAVHEPPTSIPGTEKTQSQANNASPTPLEADTQPQSDRSNNNSKDVSGTRNKVGDHPNPEKDVPLLLMSLVVLQLFIPGVWIYRFHSLWRRGAKVEPEDYLAWLTAIAVPYLILGFAMLVEYHALLEDRRLGVGAIAAIMILYALSVLASFLYIEVRDLKKSFDEKLTAASDWYALSIRLGTADAGHESPAVSITELLNSWSEVYGDKVGRTHESLESRTKSEMKTKVKLRRNAMGTLLNTYAREEARDAKGALSAYEVPKPVWPWPDSELSEQNPPSGVSFMASNTSYYANFLQEAVRYLPGAAEDHSGVFLATITYGPPPVWWNWPDSDGEAYRYSPIESYRKMLCKIAVESESIPRKATVFRRVILADGWQSDRLISKDKWDKMADWKFLISKRTDSPWTSEIRALPTEYLHAGLLVENLGWTKGLKTEQSPRGRHAYWMVKPEANDLPEAEFSLMRIEDYFFKVMHPKGQGSTKFHAIPEGMFSAPLIGGQGFNGCGEMLFLGVGGTVPHGSDVWYEDSPNLALAMLTTMSPSSETMFITVVWGEHRLGELWSGVSKICRNLDGVRN